jgi:beta-phosphoglucomutase
MYKVKTKYSATQAVYQAAIFDLDGVLVDTAKYHYRAWKKLADELGFDFSETDNERLKGVSRMRSLEILMEIAGLDFSEAEKSALAGKKNQWYVELISTLEESDVLPGARECLFALDAMGVPTALASASKNAQVVIERLNLAQFFQCIVDAKLIARAKPDPEVFLAAAKGLGIAPSFSVVFEDAPAGIEGAHAAGMFAVGVGSIEALPDADIVIPDLSHLDVSSLFCAQNGKTA